MITLGRLGARKIIRAAASSLRTPALRAWMLEDREGTWDREARSVFYRLQELNPCAAIEDIELAAANTLAVYALDAAMGSCQSGPGLARAAAPKSTRRMPAGGG